MLEALPALALALALHVGLLALIWLASTFSGGKAAASGVPGPIQVSLHVSGADLERTRAAIRAVEQRLQLVPAEQMPPQATPSLDTTSDRPLPIEFAESPKLVSPASMTKPQSELEKLAESREPRQPKDADGPTDGDSAEAPHGDALSGAGDAAQIGVDPMLEARYMAAIQAIAQANWDSSGSPAGVRCEVRFTQIAGGKVVAVEFLDCAYDAASRKAIERALIAALLPFAGFESIFARHQQETIVYCHPQEACAR